MHSHIGGRRFISALLLVIVAVSFTACGFIRSTVEDVVEQVTDTVSEGLPTVIHDEDDRDEAESEPDPADVKTEDEEAAVALDDWQNPSELADLLGMFERLEWRWMTSGRTGSERVETASYQHEGMEQVEGVQVNRILIDFDGQELRFWARDDGEVIRAEIDGEEIPDEMSMMFEGLLMSIFWPFMMAEQFDPEDIIRGTGYGWDWQILETGRESFGPSQADVTRIELTVGPPWAPEGREAKLRWGLGDFGDFQMLVEWTSLEGAEGQEFGFSMEVLTVVPR